MNTEIPTPITGSIVRKHLLPNGTFINWGLFSQELHDHADMLKRRLAIATEALKKSRQWFDELPTYKGPLTDADYCAGAVDSIDKALRQMEEVI